jgi:AraC-like DNA-binding protein
MRDLLDTRDVDQARAQVASSYCPHEIGLTGDGSGFRARHAVAGEAEVDVFRLGYGSGAVDVRPVPFRDFVLISRPIAGHLRVRSRGVDVVASAGQAVALDPTHAHHLHFGPDCRILTVKLPRTLVAGEAPDPALAAIRTGRPRDGAAWDAVSRFLLAEALPRGLLAEDSLVRRHLVQLVAAAALAGFGAPEPDRPVGRSALQRAVDFIEAEARTDIGLLDIAAAAGLGARALQEAFRRHMGTTPSGHLRAVRLRGARRELRADPDRTIAEVAHSWGFGNLGRFAAEYQRAFGRLPREDRRRR